MSLNIDIIVEHVINGAGTYYYGLSNGTMWHSYTLFLKSPSLVTSNLSSG